MMVGTSVLVVIGAALAWATFSLGLNGDVAYVLGGIEVRGGGPAPPARQRVVPRPTADGRDEAIVDPRVARCRRHPGRPQRPDRPGDAGPLPRLRHGRYQMGNPTGWAYPSPLFLRTPNRPYVLSMPGFADNARRLESDVPRWLILQPGWLDPAILPAALRAALDERYDGSAAPAAGGVIACPRRKAGPNGTGKPYGKPQVPTPVGSLPKVPPLG